MYSCNPKKNEKNVWIAGAIIIDNGIYNTNSRFGIRKTIGGSINVTIAGRP